MRGVTCCVALSLLPLAVACARTAPFYFDARGDAGELDAAVDGGGEDAGEPDAGCPEPQSWDLVTRPVAAVELLDIARTRSGSTERLVVSVVVTPSCERLGPVTLTVMPGNATDFVQLSAHVWKSMGICGGAVRRDTRVVEIDASKQDDNLQVNVTDANAPGGGMRLSYRRDRSAKGLQCAGHVTSGTVGRGLRCESDCDCRAGLACVPLDAGGGAADWTCQQLCTTELQCGLPENRCRTAIRSGSPAFVCEAGRACKWPDECPTGFRCDTASGTGQCVEARSGSDAVCVCDSSCKPGLLCLSHGSGESRCEIPCVATDDCPYPGLVFDCSPDSWTCVGGER